MKKGSMLLLSTSAIEKHEQDLADLKEKLEESQQEKKRLYEERQEYGEMIRDEHKPLISRKKR